MARRTKAAQEQAALDERMGRASAVKTELEQLETRRATLLAQLQRGDPMAERLIAEANGTIPDGYERTPSGLRRVEADVPAARQLTESDLQTLGIGPSGYGSKRGATIRNGATVSAEQLAAEAGSGERRLPNTTAERWSGGTRVFVSDETRLREAGIVHEPVETEGESADSGTYDPLLVPDDGEYVPNVRHARHIVNGMVIPDHTGAEEAAFAAEVHEREAAEAAAQQEARIRELVGQQAALMEEARNPTLRDLHLLLQAVGRLAAGLSRGGSEQDVVTYHQQVRDEATRYDEATAGAEESAHG